MSFIICVIAFILLRCKTFYPYVIAYTLCSTLALIYYVYKDMDILYYALGHIPSVKPYLSEIIENIKSGIILMISNISGMLIIGFGRFLVDTEWGIKSFSIVSFSFMLVNFFMMFVNQASLVLFPELRRWSKDRVAIFSSKLDKTLSIVTPFALLMYIPAYYFIAAWLPKYSLSVTYLVYLLPICIFDTKMNLMYNTIFKVFNNVKYLLYCNLIALSVSIVLITASIYALHSLLAVVISMLIAIACRGGIASYFSGKLVSLPGDLKRKVKEVLVILAFILIFTFCEINIASLLFFILFTIFIFMNREFLKKAYLNVKKK